MGAIKLPGYVLATFAISLGGFINGYDTGSVGAITEMEQFKQSIGHLTPTMRGFTVSLILLAGAFPAFVAGQLADRFGRLQVVMAGALLFVLGASLQGGAYHLPMFLVGRSLAGLGQGFWLSNVTVYISEIAPSHRRGALVATSQFMSCLGMCLGYFTCYGSVNVSSSMAWRAPYVIQAGVAMMLAASCLLLPQSPRWLILQGKREQAIKELDRLNFSRAEAEKDILRPGAQEASSMSMWSSIALCFKSGYRNRTFLALFTLGMVQLCGIDGVLYYAPTLFAQAGLGSQQASFLASGLSAILILAISIPATIFADRWGRRTVMTTGGIFLSGCMLLIGCLYAADVVHHYGVARWVVVVCVFVFGLTYASTWAVAGKIYTSEIQPANTRAAANCIAQGLNFFTNWLVAMITPVFLAESAYGAYFLFGGFSLTTLAVLYVYMPETCGRSLESIQEAFNRPVTRSLKHHLRRLFSLSSTVSSSGSSSSGDDRTELTDINTTGATATTAVDAPMSGALRLDPAGV
ncbi:hypothetical protein LTS18_011896 [Coniosporium uncinatum]|uniref:Uncharacterized protein n=1 Tax=Coniosporium uncinatum TaxID=93489 RepID=A0ACC3DDB1_9PEZI|nr:hypothetical protein LTS18_011896 [Coniosporium uncinatum]